MASRAIVYRRVSTDEQIESGAGLAAQLDACRAWAARERLELAGPHDETEGLSGSTPLHKRAGLGAALAELKAGDVLLVAKRDRLGRDPIVVAMIESAVNRKKCRVVSAAGEGTGDDGPTSVLMRRMIDAFAEYERLIIGGRTRAALAAKKARGERTGRVPYGKTLTDDGRRSRPKPDGSGNLPIALATCDQETTILKLMLGRRASGWTAGRIAWGLNRRGFFTKRGRPWQTSSVIYVCNSHGVRKGETTDERLRIPPEPPGPHPPDAGGPAP